VMGQCEEKEPQVTNICQNQKTGIMVVMNKEA
jgi:hypothetical protein